MRIRLFGTEIEISFLFVAVIALLLVIDRTGLIVPTLAAVLIHETGHLFAMWVNDSAPRRIRLIPTSVQIVRCGLLPPRREAAVALCGPLANLAVFLTLFVSWCACPDERLLRFGALNLILCGFNLLPVQGLDGGTLLTVLLNRRLDPFRSARIVQAVTLGFAAAAAMLGVTLWMRGDRNVSVFLLALYLLIGGLMAT